MGLAVDLELDLHAIPPGLFERAGRVRLRSGGLDGRTGGI
jgi:hypothetical protein